MLLISRPFLPFLPTVHVRRRHSSEAISTKLSRANSTNHARPTCTWKLTSALFCVSKRSRPEFEDKNDVYLAKRSPQAQFHLLPPSLLRIKNKTKTYCQDGLYGRIAENFPFYDQRIVLSPVASCNGGGHHATCHL